MFNIFVPQEIFVVAIIFCRVGAAFIQMPAIGETYISMRVRIVFASMFSLVLASVLKPLIPELPSSFLAILILILNEILVGLFLGGLTRLFLTTLSTTGTIMAFVSGFAAAQAFNPMMQGQGSIHAVLLTLTATMVIIVTNTHHLMIMAIVDSYQLFTPGGPSFIEDMTNTFSHAMSQSFRIGLQFASPFVLSAILYNTLLGLMARLMPNLQVFFVVMPLQILLGLLLFALIFSSIILWFMEYFTESLAPFLAIG